MLLNVFNGEHNRQALQELLELSDRKNFREKYLRPAIEGGFVVLVKGENKYSPKAKYKLTPLGLNIWSKK